MMSAPTSPSTTAEQAPFDIVLRGGRVVDPSSGHVGDFDVAIKDGKIAQVAANIEGPAASVINCAGQLVFPGLVEGHSHIFEHVSKVGANPTEAHLRRGVVAVADAGTAGASTFAAFRKMVVEPNALRVVNFLNVSVLGLIDFRYGELINPATLSIDDALQVAADNADVVRGFKIRLSEDVVGEDWEKLLGQSLSLAEQAGLPLMVHIGETSEPLDIVLPHLRPGDIVAHCYTGKPHGILSGGKILPAVAEARERGVLFDSAHGRSNLSFNVAREAIAEGFLPDIVSSDTSARNWRGPVFDLLTSISKLVALGADLTQVIERATIAPAKLLGIADEGYGTLAVGSPANVTVVKEVSDQVLPDAAGNSMVAPRFEPTTVLSRGEHISITPWRGLSA
jgi:dihydroorotase